MGRRTNPVRRLVVGIVGVLALTQILEVVAPKAVRAVDRLLVTINNTSANPVPTVATDTRNVAVVNDSLRATVTNLKDTATGDPVPLVTRDESADHFFQFSNVCVFSGSTECQEINASTRFSVPANETALIESVTAVCQLIPGSSVNYAQLTNGSSETFLPPGSAPVTAPNGTDTQTFAQNLKAYVTSGDIAQPVSFEVYANADQPSPNVCAYSLAGYFIGGR
jgi:hypothetical protein